jgi:hypothetical protein
MATATNGASTDAPIPRIRPALQGTPVCQEPSLPGEPWSFAPDRTNWIGALLAKVEAAASQSAPSRPVSPTSRAAVRLRRAASAVRSQKSE